MPEEEFEIGCDLVYQLSYKEHTNSDETATVRWDEIFTAIGSVLNSTSARPRKNVESAIVNLATKKFSKKSGDWTLVKVKIHSEFIAKVIDHLVRNQWINSINKERKGLHYELTELGRDAFLENQTVASGSS